jgi:hypothetical protein
MSIGGRIFTVVLMLGVLGIYGAGIGRALAFRDTNDSGIATTTPAPVTLAFAVPVADGAAASVQIANSSATTELFLQQQPPVLPRWLAAILLGMFFFAGALIQRGKYLHGGGNPLR